MRLRHPITRFIYDRQEDGTVRVDDEKGGVGIFDREGNWISGNRKHADAMLCMYVSDAYVQPYNREYVMRSMSQREEKPS